LYIVIAIVLICLLGFFIYKYVKTRKENERLQEFVDVQVGLWEKERNELQWQIEQSNKEIAVLQDSIDNIKIRIIKVKERVYEKMDSIHSLPIDGAIEFFTEQVSSEMGSGK